MRRSRKTSPWKSVYVESSLGFGLCGLSSRNSKAQPYMKKCCDWRKLSRLIACRWPRSIDFCARGSHRSYWYTGPHRLTTNKAVSEMPNKSRNSPIQVCPRWKSTVLGRGRFLGGYSELCVNGCCRCSRASHSGSTYSCDETLSTKGEFLLDMEGLFTLIKASTSRNLKCNRK